MKMTTLALSVLAGIGAGCTTVPPAPLVSMSDLPNCFDANYDSKRGLFTIVNAAGNPVNQQCLLTVGPRGSVASASRLRAGNYRIYLANGGGGGAGGTLQGFAGGGGGGGGGGAGSIEMQATVHLTEGVYKLTLGAGGPGGLAGELRSYGFGGGPGWAGSPSNVVRAATGEVIAGTPGADTYARPTRARNERTSGPKDGHGGSGPGQASGGQGGLTEDTETMARRQVTAQPGAGALAPRLSGVGGAPGYVSSRDPSPGAGVGGAPGSVSARDPSPGVGGGGGATSVAHGGGGGGESPGQMQIVPQRGTLGSGGGGGGGEGSRSESDPGARGGHGYIALRPM